MVYKKTAQQMWPMSLNLGAGRRLMDIGTTVRFLPIETQRWEPEWLDGATLKVEWEGGTTVIGASFTDGRTKTITLSSRPGRPESHIQPLIFWRGSFPRGFPDNGPSRKARGWGWPSQKECGWGHNCHKFGGHLIGRHKTLARKCL